MTIKEAKTARRSTLARKVRRRRLGVRWLGRTLTWLSTLTIVVLSLVPPSLRPTTPLPHKGEHFAIFAIWGIAFALGYRISLVYQMVCVVLFAGAIEFAQYWVPGRHARISDLVVDTLAACFGVLLYSQIFSGEFVNSFADTRRTRAASKKARTSSHHQAMSSMARKDVKSRRAR
jgi:VanZ family protein